MRVFKLGDIVWCHHLHMDVTTSLDSQDGNYTVRAPGKKRPLLVLRHKKGGALTLVYCSTKYHRHLNPVSIGRESYAYPTKRFEYNEHFLVDKRRPYRTIDRNALNAILDSLPRFEAKALKHQLAELYRGRNQANAAWSSGQSSRRR